MKKKGEDLRIIKTKNSLCGALDELLGSKDIEEVSIADICEKAGVNRSTFYKHFEGKRDFLSFYISTIMSRIADIFQTDVFMNNSDEFHIETAIWEIQKYETAISSLMKTSIPTTLIYGKMVDYFRESFRHIPHAFPGESPDLTMWSQFYAGGVMTVILSWLNNPSGTTPDKAKALSSFLSALLSDIRVALSQEQGAATTENGVF